MFELTLTIAEAEGALLRVLGTIERRGFRLGALHTHSGDGAIHASLSVDSDGRAVEVLVRQLKRLIDVREAAVVMSRPAFRLPTREPAPLRVPIPLQRSGLSWLGIPERVSIDGAFA
jgi:acetolactate synthase II small subunit